jgi:uncharacterized protein RhaS with RHS repeats
VTAYIPCKSEEALVVRLGPVVIADDPCEAAFGCETPPGPRKYYRARYYDPNLGRFIGEDPFGLSAGPNLYPYVGNNPVRHRDPSGLLTVNDDTTVSYQDDIDADCGNTAGGCERVDFNPTYECTDCGGYWKLDFTITLVGRIFIANPPFPYKGRNPKDTSVKGPRTALLHEVGHINDALRAVVPIFESAEGPYGTLPECEKAAQDAMLLARVAWNTAAEKSERTRH